MRNFAQVSGFSDEFMKNCVSKGNILKFSNEESEERYA